MDPQKRHVLMVSHDAELCELVTAVCGEAGYTVFSACDVRSVKRQFLEHRPQLAIADLWWIERGRYAVLKVLNPPPVFKMPVLIIAGGAEPASWAKAQMLGASDLLLMPWDIEELLERVERLWPRTRNKSAGMSS